MKDKKTIKKEDIKNKNSGRKTPTGKRIGKSKPSKANNQLNRRV